jgi:hypothetical protein
MKATGSKKTSASKPKGKAAMPPKAAKGKAYSSKKK